MAQRSSAALCLLLVPIAAALLLFALPAAGGTVADKLGIDKGNKAYNCFDTTDQIIMLTNEKKEGSMKITEGKLGILLNINVTWTEKDSESRRRAAKTERNRPVVKQAVVSVADDGASGVVVLLTEKARFDLKLKRDNNGVLKVDSAKRARLVVKQEVRLSVYMSSPNSF
eukprot:GHVS01083770.1.p1 GENE.GHVS01083770.1~~GHVS01083770.1.p1  ORF type:complete len:180 (+),score=28.70 GHVS01083770.1:32-541(+)